MAMVMAMMMMNMVMAMIVAMTGENNDCGYDYGTSNNGDHRPKYGVSTDDGCGDYSNGY